MKKRRKHKACLNCGELLQQKHNYCPNCGQENTDNHVSIGLLLREFTSNFFSLDSRFGRSFKPFLIRPGDLTNAFNQGRRVLYANPIRWYLVISIFHFFFLSKVFEPTIKDKQQRTFIGEDLELSEAEFDSLYNITDTTDSWPFSNEQQKLVNHLINHSSLPDEKIYDTLKLERSWISEFATKKSIRISRETTASLNAYILRQIPIIIFFILPIYAFLLKLFFWRKGLYIKHLIHSLHLHSFFFFVLGWIWVIALFYTPLKDSVGSIASLITIIYIVISFKRVYQQKTIWCILKLFMIGLIYAILLGITLLLGVLLSLALF
ncbi:Protein of unknown function [Ekhidna lutea]|uniref:DUF3667 domain-containing protein n=1 Tax=Ekhidna lutea TaxID=447679 RepID=A0A239M6Z9_EKHLU|nr:DUF3667 domain-containing protein [Ekhidna lutea]SNT37893.1 Protein of unknown function [Ekhidna lutea]